MNEFRYLKIALAHPSLSAVGVNFMEYDVTVKDASGKVVGTTTDDLTESTGTASAFIDLTHVSGGVRYGTFTIDAAGVWTYTLNNNNAAVQSLNAGQTLTDSFTATTMDGTTQLVTITITGANDAALIPGDITETGTESCGEKKGTPRATG